MSPVVITPDDLAPFADIEPTRAYALIADAMATAARVAPCINDDDFAYPEAAMAILRRVILRGNEAGTGATTTVQQTAGPFANMQVTNSPLKGRLFWPTEIADLQELCKTGNESSGAFNINTAPAYASGHLPWCDLMFGGASCSCGVDIAGYPIFEL